MNSRPRRYAASSSDPSARKHSVKARLARRPPEPIPEDEFASLHLTRKDPVEKQDRPRNGMPEDLLSFLHLTREDYKLSLEERIEKIMMGLEQDPDVDDGDIDYEEPKYGPDDKLPEGYDWVSFTEGDGNKDFVVHKDCLICHVSKAHWTSECPKRKGKGMEVE